MTQIAAWNVEKPRKPWWLGGLFLVALIISLVLNACNSGQASRLQPLKVGITTWPGFDVVLYAKETGLFQKHGLNVELIRFENQQDSSRAVLRGSLDAAFASLWDVMQVDSGNDKPVFVMVTNISHGADGIVARSGIETIEDLRHKRVAAKLGTVNHLILLEALKLHNIKPNDVKIEDIPNETAAELVEKGKLDAAVLWQPLLGETAKKSKGKVIYTTQELDSLVIDGLVSRSQVVQSKKAELTRFITTWFDVMKAVDTKPQEVFQQVGKALNQNSASFASDYSGLKKGDIAMQKQMFQTEGRLQTAMDQLIQLLQADPRHGHTPRKDVEINPEPVTAAMNEWKA
ncbi:ABC transporter substrate-binding protein [Kovacikia minuta CCNUW1]|uniref:ABC transporter substrate-binding protein n=1 Tax=Kovacikia minuta TaxID=2931930 RepID=UPI001CCD8F07|nr:ABC transporter substrate-binding protein [Kovacikia minuta]UBF28114.1 ABC transporter substrate-binding protein [Kovacikia minuta CCNUW1]